MYVCICSSGFLPYCSLPLLDYVCNLVRQIFIANYCLNFNEPYMLQNLLAYDGEGKIREDIMPSRILCAT